MIGLGYKEIEASVLDVLLLSFVSPYLFPSFLQFPCPITSWAILWNNSWGKDMREASSQQPEKLRPFIQQEHCEEPVTALRVSL